MEPSEPYYLIERTSQVFVRGRVLIVGRPELGVGTPAVNRPDRGRQSTASQIAIAAGGPARSRRRASVAGLKATSWRRDRTQAPHQHIDSGSTLHQIARMTWKPTEHMDREIRRWMKAKGWEVSCRPEYDADREICAWSHEIRGGPSPTLRISRNVLEDYPAFAVLYHLDRLGAARAIRARPEACLFVVQGGSTITLEEA